MENSKRKGGFFEQTQGKINPVVVKYYYGPRMAKSDGSFDYLVTVMEAHAIMLGEQGIIPMETAAKRRAGRIFSPSWIPAWRICTSIWSI